MLNWCPFLKTLTDFQKIAAMGMILAASLLLSGCAAGAASPAANNSFSDLYAIDPALREYYQDLGGKDVVGAVISQPYEENEVTCQYAANALLCFNPSATGERRFFLSPLSLSFHVPPGHHQPDAPVYPPFQLVIDNLLGREQAGRVLTEVLYDPHMRRIEQYFENVGFYQDMSVSGSSVRLLPYGAYVMSQNQPIKYPEVMHPENQKVAMPFATALDRLGGFSFLGQPISEPFTAADGSLEQVFENAVIYAPAGQPQAVGLRNLPIQLQMIAHPPVEKQYDLNQNVVFYPTEGELGYHVPVIFDTYIAQHGGVEISGKPIADTFRYDDQIDRQCYENYCLEYFPQAAPEQRVRLTPLGYRYLQMAGIPALDSRPSVLASSAPALPTPAEEAAAQPPQEAVSVPVTAEEAPAPAAPPGDVTLRVSRQFAEIPPDGTQVIHLTIHQAVDLQPVSGVQASISLDTPNGLIYYYAPPTNASGRASFAVPPIEGVESGSVIGFDVCLEQAGGAPVCEHGSYLVMQ